MERIRCCAAGFFLAWVGALLGGGGAWGQAIGRAVVYPVPTTGEAGRFQVPQVRLADAAVARRINRSLLRRFRDGSFGEVDSMASPQRQLRQAARLCCYDEETKSWRAGGDGLTDTYFGVLLNQNYLLSLEFRDSWGGLQKASASHLTFDLRTGRVLTVADLVADPSAQLCRRLAAAVSRRLRNEIAQQVAQHGDDSARIADLALLYFIETWDTTPQRARAIDLDPALEDSTILASFTRRVDFALTPGALLLFNPIEMARIDFEFLPDDTYTFPYGRIQPKGLLLPVAEAARRRKPLH